MGHDIRIEGVGHAYGYLHNYYPAEITVDHQVWPTAEHYYQGMKFVKEAPEIAEQIRCIPSPTLAFDMGQRRDFPLCSDWDTEFSRGEGNVTRRKLEIMRQAIKAKFDQHVELRNQLIRTQGRRIRERSTPDAFWGEGEDGLGENKFGELLMELRQEYLENRHLQ
jgi:ribA/ribD-fused uncharacterized protein